MVNQKSFTTSIGTSIPEISFILSARSVQERHPSYVQSSQKTLSLKDRDTSAATDWKTYARRAYHT